MTSKLFSVENDGWEEDDWNDWSETTNNSNNNNMNNPQQQQQPQQINQLSQQDVFSNFNINTKEESYNIYNNNPTPIQGFDGNKPNNIEVNNIPNINMAHQYPSTSSTVLASGFHKDYSLLKNDLPPPPPAENIMADDLYKNSQQKMFPPPPTMYGVAAKSHGYEQRVQPHSSTQHTSSHDHIENTTNHWMQQQNIVDATTQVDNNSTSSMWHIPVEQGRTHIESFFPENREQPDDGRAETYNLNIDRHNYLVTGQLSFNRNIPSDTNELLPPPGLSRLVVGQTENNNELLGTNSMLPPGLNRLVTGKDSNNIDFQRQADGEVSQENVQRTLVHNQYNQDMSDVSTFNTNDRSLYFAAGESDAIQRFITGVESDDALPSIIATNLSQLNINNDDDDEVADLVQRNINVDGENITDTQSIETPHERDEVIDGAIDNSLSIINSLSLTEEHHEAKKLFPPTKKIPLSNERETEEREEDIEGANSLYKVQHKSAEIELSSDISGNNLETNKTVKTKSRSNTKYNVKDSNDTESGSNTPRKNNNEKRHKRSSKEKKLRDINQDKYQRRERGRDEYERRGKPDYQERDSDGSKYDTERSIREKQRHNSNDGSIERKDRYGRGSKYSSRTKNEKEEKDRQKSKYRGQHSDRYESSRKSDYYDDERERHKSSRYAYDEDYYNRKSRNEPDREHRREKKTASASSYYQQPAAGYTAGYDQQQYTYYQQKQYYETLRRTNPQAYEWYMNYYGMMQQAQLQVPTTVIPTDDISLHSGYSSNNEKERTTSFNIISNTARLTPKKFHCSHITICLNNGLKTSIDSTATLNNGILNLVKIENIQSSDKLRSIYHSYPGPLVKKTSHKKTIIEFCEEQLKQKILSDGETAEKTNKTSYALLWNYLILVLRQNGNYTEGDISELLMRNAEEYESTIRERAGGVNVVSKQTSLVEHTDDASENDEIALSLNNPIVLQEQTLQQTMSEEVVLQKFREFLLYGNVNDALEFATDSNLWGHALFLASKVDRRQHANVMLKFANKLPYNDPLQTLYQIMSGRMPACVTNFDEKWGDWRPHLAMIISNCTDKPELVKKSIMAMGDTLFQRNDIYGSQFCYLLVDSEFTDYTDISSTAGKLVLLGASHQQLSFKAFATTESIIMTEIYEFARSLSNDNFFIPQLQKYKYLLANRFLDQGMQLKCLLYMEQITNCIVHSPDAFEVSFIAKVYEEADRLKFYDPVMEKSYEENYNNNDEVIENQKWLQDLQVLLYDKIYRKSEKPSPSSVVDNNQESEQLYLMQQVQHSLVYESGMEHQFVDNYNYNNATDQQEQYSTELSEAKSYIEPLQQQEYQPTYDPANSYQLQQQQQQQPLQQQGHNYEWNQPSQQPTITMGNSMSANKDNQSDEKQGNSSATKKLDNDKGTKKNTSIDPIQGSSTWFGGIFSMLKPKNQMILPDDKNPTIVWDPQTKKWINKDGENQEGESFKPPPKMDNLMMNKITPPQKQQQISQQQLNTQPPATSQYNTFDNAVSSQITGNQMPGNNMPVAQIPASDMPNMFKMQRGRNLKKSYVDVLGNSGQTIQPKSDLMDTNFFNPSVHHSGGQEMQFYNPNDFN
ncbi:unnamed protein product [Diamesa serratosioi]